MDYKLKITFNGKWLEDWIIIDDHQDFTIDQYIEKDRHFFKMLLEDYGFKQDILTNSEMFEDGYDLITTAFSDFEQVENAFQKLSKVYGKYATIKIIGGAK
jgi:hypothetical protein